MKVNFLLKEFPKNPSGGMKVIYQYANYLAENGHEVVFYYKKLRRGNSLRNIVHNLRWRYIVHKGITWFAINSNIITCIVEEFTDNTVADGDVVIATEVVTAEPCVRLAKTKGQKYYFVQGFENWEYDDEYVYETYRLPLIKIAVSKWLKELIENYTSNKVRYVGNGINTELFKVTNPIEGRNEHSIVFQYRSAKEKGCIYAIEAIKLLKLKYNDLVVDIISNEQIDRKVIPDYCRYHYSIKPVEVARLNNKAAVFMCSSISEGFGLPGLEAMACGCAVVSSSYAGVLDYAVNGKNALLVPCGDAKALAEKISWLFEHRKERIALAKEGSMTGLSRGIRDSCSAFEKILSE